MSQLLHAKLYRCTFAHCWLARLQFLAGIDVNIFLEGCTFHDASTNKLPPHASRRIGLVNWYNSLFELHFILLSIGAFSYGSVLLLIAAPDLG
jgi:hypothetical protein